MPADLYAFSLYSDTGIQLVADLLNSGDGFSQTISTGLGPGFYTIGLQTITDPPADPSFAITFGAPVNPVPEPTTLTLTALGLVGAAARYRRRRSRREP